MHSLACLSSATCPFSAPNHLISKKKKEPICFPQTFVSIISYSYNLQVSQVARTWHGGRMQDHIAGFPLTCPDKIPWLSLTFLDEFSLTFPDPSTVVFIQTKQFEDNGSPSTRTTNILAYVENKERAWRQVGLWWYRKIPAVDTFPLMRKVWKLYNVWPRSKQNSLTFPDHSQGIKNNSLIFPKY